MGINLEQSGGGAGGGGTTVITKAKVTSLWLDSFTSTTGLFTASQPAFTDISGSVAASQLPNPSASTLGGIESIASVASKWINAISTAGVPSATQPAASDLSVAALANGITATTQAALSNDTKVATDAYVDGAVTAAVNTPQTSSAGGGPYLFGGLPIGFVPFGLTANLFSNAVVVASANQVYAFLFYVGAPIAINKLTIKVTTIGAGGELIGMGIYNLSKNKVFAATFATTGVAVVTSSLGATSTLQPGWYYFAYTSSAATAQAEYWTSTSNLDPFAILNTVVVRAGALAANASASGVLPATLGALSFATNRSMFVCLMET